MDVSPHPLLDLVWIKQQTGKDSLTISEAVEYSDVVGANILFDVEYYKSNYGHTIPEGMSCLEHFCRQEKENPRNPNPLFSTQQWHETLGWRVPEGTQWQRELFTSMGKEAQFAREELRRQETGSVIISDRVIGQGPTAGQEICLFVHYDHLNVVQSYVYHYLDVLAEQGLAVVFLTNCPTLDQQSLSQLKSRVWRVVHTSNEAYDFGQYAIGVRLLNRLGYKNHPILLANDSVVATLGSLDPFFALARSGSHDFVGAVDCNLHHWHLQSYFLYFSEKLANSAIWRDFWEAYRPHSSRWFVVNAHEFGLSRWMVRHGVRSTAAWKYADLITGADNARGSPWRAQCLAGKQDTNPTTELWDIALKAGFPFLKKALFNIHLESDNLSDLCNVISTLSVELQKARAADGKISAHS